MCELLLCKQPEASSALRQGCLSWGAISRLDIVQRERKGTADSCKPSPTRRPPGCCPVRTPPVQVLPLLVIFPPQTRVCLSPSGHPPGRRAHPLVPYPVLPGPVPSTLSPSGASLTSPRLREQSMHCHSPQIASLTFAAYVQASSNVIS